MFPYTNRLRWHLGGRHAHLVTVADEHAAMGGHYGRILQARTRTLARVLRVRLVFLILLSIGYLAVIAAWLSPFLPGTDLAYETISVVGAALSAFAGLLTLVVLALNRWLGRLEMDCLACLALGAPRKTRRTAP